MPVSPFQRAAEEGLLNQQTDGSDGVDGEPTKRSRRHKRQKIKEKYAKAREEAQAVGLIPTTPEGAIKSEVVDPASQGRGGATETGILVQRAIRNGWATPDGKKPGLVDELVAIVEDGESGAKAKISAFNALRMADQHQWERDHPEDAGKARGGTSVSVNATAQAAIVLREAIASGQIGGDATATPPNIPGSSGDGGHEWEGTEPTAPESHNERAGESVAHTEQQDSDNCPIPARQESALLGLLSRVGAAVMARDAHRNIQL